LCECYAIDVEVFTDGFDMIASIFCEFSDSAKNAEYRKYRS